MDERKVHGPCVSWLRRRSRERQSRTGGGGQARTGEDDQGMNDDVD